MIRILIVLGAVVGTLIFFLQFQEVSDEGPIIVRNPPHATSSTMISTTTPVVPSIAESPATSTPHASSTVTVEEAGWKAAIATVFWVGEGATSDNGFIHNAESAWDGEWMTHFGGVDDPGNRCGFLPCGFMPKENPFYIALPYNDLDDRGNRKSDARVIPWNDPGAEKSVLKNRWIEVRVDQTSCFGQWQDVGPFYEDDAAYVFGTAITPKNVSGEKAGIDLSPALATCLSIDGSDEVVWRHRSVNQVPQGAWKDTITTRSSQ